MAVSQEHTSLTSRLDFIGVAWSNSQSDPLTVDLKTFQDHLSVNTISAFVAAQEAVKSFNKLADNPTPPVFIYTGNKLNIFAFPPLLTLGVGKVASSHIIEYFSKVYREKGYGYMLPSHPNPLSFEKGS